MKKFTFISVFFSFLLISFASAQQVNTKWKKVTKKDFKISLADKYPDASAVVLFKIGSACFDVVQNEFKVIYDVHCRIKILTKDGYEWADVSIPFYSYDNYEKVSTLNGYTYNLTDGKIEKEKLRNRDVYEEEIDERWSQLKFSMPAVKVGSVIEYKYTITSSDFIYFRDWEFQFSIPVLYNEFTTRVPEYFRYATFFQGMENLDTHEKNTYSDVFTFHVESDANTRARNFKPYHRNEPLSGLEKIKYIGVKSLYIMKDVPPLKDIPFVPTMNDYVAKIRFQLADYTIPGYNKKEFYTTWNDLCERILDNQRIGRQLKRNNRLKKMVDEITSGIDDPKTKMITIYNYVAKSMKWDGFYRYAVYDDLNQAFSEKKGNSAEINLILTLMLREAGLKSHPVLVSTRSHGKILQAYPVLNQFNHLINYTVINNKEYLLDAIHYDRPFNLLPKQDLNGKGFVAVKNDPFWVDLKNPMSNTIKNNVIADFDEDLNLICISNSENTGYYAQDKYTEYSNDKDQYLNDHFISKMNDLKLDTFMIQKKDNNIIKEHIKFYTTDFVGTSDDMIYFQPMLLYTVDNNPLKRESRKIPVDFNYPFEETYVLNLTIPEEYELVETPESIKLLLPNSGGEFLYHINQTGNIIQLLCTTKINKTIYTSKEYPYLKELFDGIVSKHAEPIVLKKTGK